MGQKPGNNFRLPQENIGLLDVDIDLKFSPL